MKIATVTRNPWFNKGKLYCPIWCHTVVTLDGQLLDPETYVEAKGATDGEDPNGYVMRKARDAQLVRDNRTGATINYRGVHRVNGAVALLRVASTSCSDCIDTMRDAQWWRPDSGFNEGAPITLTAAQVVQYRSEANELFAQWSARDRSQDAQRTTAQATAPPVKRRG